MVFFVYWVLISCDCFRFQFSCKNFKTVFFTLIPNSKNHVIGTSNKNAFKMIFQYSGLQQYIMHTVHGIVNELVTDSLSFMLCVASFHTRAAFHCLCLVKVKRHKICRWQVNSYLITTNNMRFWRHEKRKLPSQQSNSVDRIKTLGLYMVNINILVKQIAKALLLC